MDEKSKMLIGRLDFFERNVKTLHTGIKAVLRNHEEGSLQSLDLSQKVRDIAAQEQFLDLQEDLIAIAEAMEKVATERKKILCERGDQKILSALKYIQDKIVHPTKLMLKDRERAVKKYDTMAKRAGTRADPRNILTTEDEAMRHQRVADYRQCVKNTDEIVDSNFRYFEKQRVVELKVMLEEVMRAEMLYHCRALELLESVCVNVRQLDPDRAMQEVTDELNELNAHHNPL